MRKQPERTAKTRQGIMDSFWKIYCEKRIDKITVKEISNSAGIYRSTFYEYFSDVYDVLNVIEEELLKELNLAWDKMLESDNLESATEYIIDFYEKNGEMMAVLLGPNGDQGFYTQIKERIKLKLYSELDIDSHDYRLEIALNVLPATALTLLQYWYEQRDEIALKDVLLVGRQLLGEGLIPTMKEFGLPFL